MKKSLTLVLAFGLFAHVIFAQIPVVCSTGLPTPADNCANACLPCSLNGYTGTTVGFSAGVAPSFCGTVENDQWIGFIAASTTSSFTLTPSNCANNQGLELAIYQNCNGTPLACSFGLSGSSPVSVFTSTTPGQTYFLVVDGIDGDGCDFVVTTASVAPPVLGATGTITGQNTAPPFSSVVYSIPPVANAAFYTWSAPPGSKINGQNPPLQVPGPNGNQVTVTFDLNAGDVCVKPGNACAQGTSACKQVDIVITNYLAPPCPSNLEPTAEDCAQACVYCNFNGLSGNTSGFMGGFAAGFCGTIENDQWIGFIPSAAAATLTAVPSNCTNGDGIQLALYDDCGGVPVPDGCYMGCTGCGTTPASITVNLVPGQTYFLMVDGYAGDQCDFTLDVTPPLAVQAPPLGPTGQIQGLGTVCPGATVLYSVPPTAGAAAYGWSAPAGSLINGEPTPLLAGNIVAITFPNFANQSGGVCVQALSSCASGNIVCKNVTIASIPPTIFPPVIICNEDTPYELPWGDLANASGLYQYVYTSWLGCDSVVKQQVTVKLPIVKNLPPQAICAGDSIVICGVPYTQAGNYSEVCTSYQGCDSTVNFTVLVLNPVAQINGGSMLSCDNPFIVLTSTASTGTKIWRDLSGTVLGTGTTLTVNDPGTYILTVTASISGIMCMAMDTVVVSSNTSPPNVSAFGDSLTCSNPMATLVGESSAAGVVFSWSGPNGFVSTLQNPAVTQGGTYTLIVTDANGCSNSATAEVVEANNIPSATLGAGQITCSFPTQTINLQTNASNPSFFWEGPNGFSSMLQNPLVADSGTYTVTISDGITSCLRVAAFTVTADVATPGASIVSDPIDCIHPVGILHGHSPTADVNYTWIWPGGTLDQQDIPVMSLDTYTLVVTAPNGCTSTATGSISIDLDVPTASVNDVILTCALTSAILHGESTTPGVDYTWIGPGVVLQQQDIEVSQPGAYVLVVTAPNGCTSTATGLVLQDIIQPPFMPNAGILSCTTQSTFIDCGCGDGNISMVSWTGPNGFTANTSFATVTAPGVYQLEVTNVFNGCSATATVVVSADFAEPLITVDQVTDDQNSQGIGAIDITISGGTMPYDVQWYWNGVIFTTAEDPMSLFGGNYFSIVSGANGCSDTVFVTVQNIVPTQEPLAQNLWEVFPNPADHYLDIRYAGANMPEAQFTLLDATGRVVLENSTNGLTTPVFDLSSIPAGAYAFCIRTHEGILTKIITIQR